MASKSKTDTASIKASADRRKVGQKKASTPLTAYLVAYNALSCLAWSAILVLLLWHILDPEASAPISSKTASFDPAPVAASFAAKVRQVLLELQRLLARVLPGVHEPVPASLASTALTGAQARLRSGYNAVGPLVKVVQTFAVMEIVHALLGWVRSPVATTAAQVASRLWSVWAVAENFPSARSSSAYSIMVFAWSLTEVVRYAFYATNLLNLTPSWLNYLRYSTFLALYPVGAGSEAWSSFVTLPSLSTLPAPIGPAVASLQQALGTSHSGLGAAAAKIFGRAIGSTWSTFDLARAALVFVVWPPALYVMYSYMASQRRKALGKKPTVVGSQKKRI